MVNANYTKIIECETVIVGAGMAGISAAINLINKGHQNIVILEANDRIGGRCYTSKIGRFNKVLKITFLTSLNSFTQFKKKY